MIDLWLQKNQLSGPIPAELGQLTAVTCLALAQNQLSGPIPAEVGQLGALTGLYLHENYLSGQDVIWAYLREHNTECSVML